MKKLASLLAIISILGAGCPSELDKDCRSFNENQRQEFQEKYESIDYSLEEFSDFYSKKLEICIEASVNEVDGRFNITDTRGGFIKDWPSSRVSIFDCSKNGVNNTILEKVLERQGYVYQVSYSEYLDDYEGGEPATLKTPALPYSKEKCRALFNKKLEELR